jgi:hypothetical protein
MALRRALTVRGAKCLNRASFASPFPLMVALHSTLETEPALGSLGVDNVRAPGNALIALFVLLPEKHLSYDPEGRAHPEVLHVPSEITEKG